MSTEGNDADKPALSPELKATEALFAALRPTVPAIDRDRLMYEAGIASARRKARRFGISGPSAMSFAALAASLLVGLWIGRRTAQDEPRHVVITRAERVEPAPTDFAVPVDDSESAALVADSYAELRKYLATAELEWPTRTSPPDDQAPEAGGWRRRQAELLESLN